MGNVILGANGIAIRQGIYSESSVQMTDLGRFIDFEDGRRFRYCKASGAVTKGTVVQASAIDTNHSEQLQTGYGLSIGQKDNISVLLTAAPTSNEYADGYMICNVGTGLGQMYRIRKNTAAYSPCKLWLYDPIVTAIPAASEISLIKNKYLDVVTVIATTPTGVPVGVPLITITIGGYYFWAQTRGYCPILADSTVTLIVGNNVIRGATVAGSMVQNAADVHPVYGELVSVCAASEYAVINLKLE